MKSTLLALMFTLSVLPAASFAASNPDAAFYKHAAEGGIAEVEAGRMAQDKGNSQQVKVCSIKSIRTISQETNTDLECVPAMTRRCCAKSRAGSMLCQSSLAFAGSSCVKASTEPSVR